MSKSPEIPQRQPEPKRNFWQALLAAEEAIPMGTEANHKAQKAEVEKAVFRLWQVQQAMQSEGITSASLMEIDKAYGDLLEARTQRRKNKLLKHLQHLRRR
jgi:hypothetical protein